MLAYDQTSVSLLNGLSTTHTMEGTLERARNLVAVDQGKLKEAEDMYVLASLPFYKKQSQQTPTYDHFYFLKCPIRDESLELSNPLFKYKHSRSSTYSSCWSVRIHFVATT